MRLCAVRTGRALISLTKVSAAVVALLLVPACGEGDRTRRAEPAPAQASAATDPAIEAGALSAIALDPAQRARLEEDQQVFGDLVAGVHAGQAELIHMLGAVASDSVAFRLRREDARELEDGLVTADYLDADLAVFHRVADGADGQPLWLHFDQRNLQLSAASFEAEPLPPTQGDETAPRHRLVWRLLRSLPTAAGGRALWRYTFILDGDRVAFDQGQRLTTDPGNQILPLLDREREVVYYLDRRDDARHLLRRVPLAGGASEAVIAKQDFDVRHPRLLADGRLVIAADPENDYRLYVLDPTDGRMRPMRTEDRPDRSAMPRYMLAGIAIGGRIEPRVVRVPERLDLLSIVALVAAHNPAVNRRRALLAASLVDAAGLRPRTTTTDARVGALESRQLLGDGLRYGLFGLTDEHFDLPADTRLSDTGRMRAEIARDALELELADQQFSAIELFFACRQHQTAIAVLKARRFATRERSHLIESRRAEGHALAADALRLDAAVEEIDATLAWRQRLLDYATRRLAEICGLPAGAPIELTEDDYRCDRGFAPGPQQLHELAMLNHPRLRGARLALAEAFASGTAERLAGPGGYFAVAYGLNHQRYADPLQSYIDRSFAGEPRPGGTTAAKRWDAMHSALRLAETQAVHAVSADVEAALDAYEGARLNFARHRSELASALEQLRLARLHAELGPADPEHTPHPEAHLLARETYLKRLGEIAEARWDVSLAFARVWREASLPSRMVREVESADATVVARRRPAVYLRDAAAVIADDDAMADFVDDARSADCKRVYLDLGPGADLLDDPLGAGRLDMFLNRCAVAEIEVWVVLGGPDQLPDEFVSPYVDALERLQRYRQRHRTFEPKLGGIQLAFQPAADPRWAADETWRAGAANRLLDRIAQARERFGDLPLWLQAPPQLFSGADGDLLQDLAVEVDGLTLLAASDRPERILGWSMRGLGLWGKGLELALELSPDAPAERTTAGWTDEQRARLIEQLEDLHVDDGRYHGVAWHSYRHWRGTDATGRR